MRKTGAGVAVLRGEDVLVIRRKDNGLWDIPGGGKKWWESPAAAARRELREETGLNVGGLRPLGVWEHRHTYPDGNVVDWTTHLFAAADTGEELRAQDDAAEARWWPLAAPPAEIAEVTVSYLAAVRTLF